MFKPSVDDTIAVMREKGYRVYDTADVDWNLNIIGIRSAADSPNKFDDVLMIFHRLMGEWNAYYYPITTDPSPHYLRNPINRAGTAILKEGQYAGCYKLDTHRRGSPGAHKALCQRLGQVVVYRDNNKNGKLNYVNAQSGMFGINIHKGPRNGDWDSANSLYSAGCQVFADSRHFAEFILKCEYGAEAFGDKFTYTLLRETEFA